MIWRSDLIRMDEFHRIAFNPNQTTIRSKAITDEEKVDRDEKTTRLRRERLSRQRQFLAGPAMRTTETEIKFARPFVVGSLVAPLAAGTYRLSVDEELIDGISFVAYRKVAAYLELPSIETPAMRRQHLQVSHAEIEAALLRDNRPIAELPEDHA